MSGETEMSSWNAEPYCKKGSAISRLQSRLQPKIDLVSGGGSSQNRTENLTRMKNTPTEKK